MGWQRARQPEQKNARIASILLAAGELFDEREVTEVSMRDIAARAGMGKASLYHYFKTKEEVFLAMHGDELVLWLESLERRLGRMRSPTPKRVAAALVKELRDRPRFCRLMAILSSVLERNLSDQAIADFKESLLIPKERFVAGIQQALPALTDREARDFLFQHHAVVAGMRPIAYPTEQMAAVLEEPEYKDFRIDFFGLLEQTFMKLLQGSVEDSVRGK
ncbi:transcriptional regulator BetI [Roseimaritima multifibrata]|uniref:Transcriptional regulator BetI n=2 Tax=Roseimaritima multifibrata TaxID=1930274 RepID=A0A517MAI6_9BACT|nr:transcriptional regulator BetI [Roseimaritima multifibrata]